MAAPDRIGNDVGDGFRFLAIVEEIEHCARRPGDPQTLVGGPLPLSQDALVKPHIGAPRLPALRQDEAVLVSGKVAKAE